VAPELMRKFGKSASTSHTTVQNRMGAKYPQIVHLCQRKMERKCST
jgi:hypothetical protein